VLPWSPYWGGNVEDIENVLNFAMKRGKPTLIAESSPFGGIELKQVSKDAKLFLTSNEYDHDDWARWFGRVIDIINKYDVGMWCFINCNWEAQPMWHKVGFGESRLSANPRVMSQWHEQIVNNGRKNRKFLSAGSLENCGVDYDTPDVDQPVIESNAKGAIGSNHFYSFILVPFLVVSGAFFIPYFILGGYTSRRRSSSEQERRPLLSSMDEPTRAPPAWSSGPGKPTAGASQC